MLEVRPKLAPRPAPAYFPSPGTPGEGQGGGLCGDEDLPKVEPPPQPSPGVPEEGEIVARILPRRRIIFTTACILAVCVIALIISFVFAKDGRTPFGATLGGDFPCFYVAAGILSNPGGSRLYDTALQGWRLHHLILTEPGTALPYAYPPVVAAIFRPLASLSYPAAAAVWTLVSGMLYVAGLAMLFATCQSIPRRDRWTAVLLSLAFEPFIVECLHGGQISTIGFAAACAAIALDRRGRPFLCGLALGLMAYKPTLLAILLPMFLFSGRWKILLGTAVTVLVGVVASVLGAGSDACLAFLRLMLTYLHAAAHGDGFAIWKFVDLSAFLKLLTHRPDAPAWPICLAGAVTIWALLARRNIPNSSRWAIGLAATLCFNVYVGVYDSILIVPSLWLTADLLYQNEIPQSGEFHWLLASMFIVPFFSPFLAKTVGLQLFTLILLWAIWQQVRLISRRVEHIPRSAHHLNTQPRSL
jgi:alpha-1,2-mannosyltransferase